MLHHTARVLQWRLFGNLRSFGAVQQSPQCGNPHYHDTVGCYLYLRALELQQRWLWSGAPSSRTFIFPL